MPPNRRNRFSSMTGVVSCFIIETIGRRAISVYVFRVLHDIKVDHQRSTTVACLK